MSCEWCSTATKLRAENARLRAEGEEMDARWHAEVANLTAERDHWKQARESAMAAGEVLQAENARLREALVEARAALRHASVNIAYTKSKAAADDIDRVLQALAATDRPKPGGSEEGPGAIVAEIVADLRGQAAVAWRPGNESNDTHNALREAADTIEKKWGGR